jgi:hypothetical protein
MRHRSLLLFALVAASGCGSMFKLSPTGTYAFAGVSSGDVEPGTSLVVGRVDCVRGGERFPAGVEIYGQEGTYEGGEFLRLGGDAGVRYVVPSDSTGAFRAEVQPGFYVVRAGRFVDHPVFGPQLGPSRPGRLCRDGSITDSDCGCEVETDEFVVDSSSTVRVHVDMNAGAE